MTSDDIRAIEERALSAWPALQTVMVDGWALRFSGGFTKRANSVNALKPSGNFAGVQREAERLYAAEHLPAIFRLSPLAPPDADAILEAAGYQRYDPSLFMTASLTGREFSTTAELANTPSREWLDGFAAANAVEDHLRSAHDAIVQTLALPAAFATLRNKGEAIGFGLGVFERGMIGLFDIVVMPHARGRGAGRAITESLLAWGHNAGAETAYLSVRSVNAVALSLYESLGFREAYPYHYRVPTEC